MSYESDIKVDYENLHMEWVAQPDLTYHYGKEVAEARAKVDRLKESLDVEEAQALMRAFIPGPDGKKPTVDQAKSVATVDPLRQLAAADLNEARRTLGLVQAAYEAIQVKKSALENLVRLHGQQYFAGPVEPKVLGERTGVTMDQKATTAVRNRSNEAAREAASRVRPRGTT
jgi:hypothetical protein